MTTHKRRLTCYLNTDDIDRLYDAMRSLAPIDRRGRVSRSTVIETAVQLALADVRANGRAAALYQAMVTLPGVDDTAEETV